MRVLIAPVGDEWYHHATAEVFRRWARADLAREHALVHDVEAADCILVVGLHQMGHDPTLRSLRAHPLTEKYASKLTVYDERDRPFFTFPGIYVSAGPRLAGRAAVVGGPYAGVAGSKRAKPSESPDLLFSFRGATSHPVRRAILRLRHPRAIVEESSHNFFGADAANEVGQQARVRHSQLLSRSKFVLCPRGAGTSSLRLYETLAAGRVPVVISDGWIPPPRLDWRAAIVRVCESDVTKIPALLEGLEPEWPQLVDAGAQLFQSAFAPEMVWHYTCESLEAVLRGRPAGHSHWRHDPQFWVTPLLSATFAARRKIGELRHRFSAAR